MLGMATLTIVPSRNAIPEPRVAATSVRRATGDPHRSPARAGAVHGVGLVTVCQSRARR